MGRTARERLARLLDDAEALLAVLEDFGAAPPH